MDGIQTLIDLRTSSADLSSALAPRDGVQTIHDHPTGCPIDYTAPGDFCPGAAGDRSGTAIDQLSDGQCRRSQ